MPAAVPAAVPGPAAAAAAPAPGPARGPRVVVVQHQDHVPLGRLGPALARTGVTVTTVRPDRGEPLPGATPATGGEDPLDVADVDALVVLGGTMSAYDDGLAPWLPGVRALLHDAVAAGVPTLGVCLGAQLLAVALGGDVRVDAPGGPERGVVELRLRPDAAGDPLLGPVVAALGRTVPVPSSHADAVTVLPRGATWLASSRRYPYQAFRAGTGWGLQFHPEADADRLADWAVRSGEDPQRVRAEHAVHAARLHRLGDVVGSALGALAHVRAARRTPG